MSELESALAALVPRMEGLNRDRLMFLAGQASVEPKIAQPAVGQVANLPSRRQIGSLPHSWPRRSTRWGWPAAFAAMTGLAASLLVALAIRPAPPVIERIVARTVNVPAAAPEPVPAVAGNRVDPSAVVESSAKAAVFPDWLAWLFIPQSDANAKHELTYPEFRNQALAHGLESWKLQAFASAAPGRIQDEPVLDRERLNRWLEHDGVEKALRRLSTPTLYTL